MSHHPFDALARDYWWLEAVSFGPLLQQCRTAHLERLLDSHHALVVGDGDGRFIAALLRSAPHLRVDAIDISPGMIRQARRRTEFASDRIRFTIGDILTTPLPEDSYDLIITNFFLDCFPAETLSMVINRLATAATQESRWLVSDFAIPPGKWKAPAAHIALTIMYRFFRITTQLPANELFDPSDDLRRNGFTPIAEWSRLGGFLTSGLWQRVTVAPLPATPEHV